MKGLFRNNFFVVYSNAKVFALVMLLIGIFVAAVVSPSLLVGYTLLGMIGFSSNAFAGLGKEYTSRWGRYKLTTPVKRSDIVKSYYISQLLWLLVGIVFAGTVIALSTALHGFPFDRSTDIFTLLVVGSGISLFMGAIFFPLFYLGGEERSEVFLIVSLLGGGGLVMGLSSLFNKVFPHMSVPQLVLSEAVIFACALMAFILSCPLTVAVFKRREF